MSFTADYEDVPPTIDWDVTVSADTTAVFNPVIAQWDDSGTTRLLEACPKMLLPILTESTGDWYADCATADSVLTDPTMVSNCVGYTESAPDTFTATDGGTQLDLDAELTGTINPRLDLWGSVNLGDGDVLRVAFTITNAHSAAVVYGKLYDDTGTLAETINSTSSSGTMVFAAVNAGPVHAGGTWCPQ
jgi:hypothetical protein